MTADKLGTIIGWTIAYALFALILGAILGAGWWLQSYQCQAKWDGTYSTEWGPIVGCRVNINGRFIPETNVRDMQ